MILALLLLAQPLPPPPPPPDARPTMHDVRAACRPVVKRFCRRLRKRALMACLQDHEDVAPRRCVDVVHAMR